MLRLCRSLLFIILLLMMTTTVLPAAPLQERGIEQYNAGKFQDAADLLRKTVSANPDDLEARYYLGLSLLELDKSSEAEIELNKAAALRDSDKEKLEKPSEGQLKVALGRAFMGQKKYGEARESLEKAKKINPNNSQAFLYSGELGVEQKDYKSAVQDLEKAVSLDAKNPYAHYYLGIAYSNTGRPDKMAEHFQLFLKMAPNAPEANKVRSLLKKLR